MMLNVSLEGFLQRIESDQIWPGSLAEADTSHHPGWGWRELESGCRLGRVLPEPRQKAAHCLSCPGSNVNTSVISSPELKPSVLCQESRAQLGFIIVPNLVLVIKEAILTRQNTIYPDQTRRTFIFNCCSYFLCVSRFILFDTVSLMQFRSIKYFPRQDQNAEMLLSVSGGRGKTSSLASSSLLGMVSSLKSTETAVRINTSVEDMGCWLFRSPDEFYHQQQTASSRDEIAEIILRLFPNPWNSTLICLAHFTCQVHCEPRSPSSHHTCQGDQQSITQQSYAHKNENNHLQIQLNILNSSTIKKRITECYQWQN